MLFWFKEFGIARDDRKNNGKTEGGVLVLLTLICLCGTAFCYYLGVRDPGRRSYGTGRGWVLSLLIGLLLVGLFYAFSAFGLMVSLDTLFNDL